MADELDKNIPVAVGDYPSLEFEDLWHGVTLLGAGIPALDVNQPAFINGVMSPQFEDIWSIAAGILVKDEIDTNVILVIDNHATPEFEAYWKELIT